MGFDGSSMKAGLGRRRATPPALVVATLLAALAAAPSRAQETPQPDSPIRALMKAVGAATDVDPPPDFVVQSRAPQPPASISAFTTPPEPPGKVKTEKELEEMDSELETVGKRHDALRAAFPPAAKALAEAAAAKKEKAKSKTRPGGPLP